MLNLTMILLWFKEDKKMKSIKMSKKTLKFDNVEVNKK